MSEIIDEYVVHGPIINNVIPKTTLGIYIHEQLNAIKTEKNILIDASTDKLITNKQLSDKAYNLFIQLNSFNYNPDTIIAICTENSAEFFIATIATFYLGCILNPINHLYTINELKHCLNITKPKIIFCSLITSSNFIQLKNQLEFIERIIVLDGYVDGLESMNEILKGNRNFDLKKNVVKIDSIDRTCLIVYSSGTTGLPKGVMLTHRNILRAMERIKDNIQLNDGSTLCVAPFFHSYGFNINFNAILTNTPNVYFSRFTIDKLLNAIEKYDVKILWLVPSILVALSKITAPINLSKIKEILSAGSSLDGDTENRLKTRFGIESIRQGYGLSETTLGVLTVPPGTQKPGSVGQINPGMSCKVCHPTTGRTLGPGQIGEFRVKGDMIMKGYYDNPDATANSFDQTGFLCTGDLVYYDDNRYFYVVGRIKELIKYKGYQVAPTEIETILLEHPDILDAAVIGLPDPEAGELPMAFIVRKNGSNLNEQDVQQHVADKVSPQKRLRGGVRFVETIAKNTNGKILRHEMKKLLGNNHK